MKSLMPVTALTLSVVLGTGPSALSLRESLRAPASASSVGERRVVG